MGVENKINKLLAEKLPRLQNISNDYWEIVGIVSILRLIKTMEEYRMIPEDIMVASSLFLNSLYKNNICIPLELESKGICSQKQVNMDVIKDTFDKLWEDMDINETFEAWKKLCEHSAIVIFNDISDNIDRISTDIQETVTDAYRCSKEGKYGEEDTLKRKYRLLKIRLSLLVGTMQSLFGKITISNREHIDENIVSLGDFVADKYMKVTIMDKNNILYLLYCLELIENINNYTKNILGLEDVETICLDTFKMYREQATNLELDTVRYTRKEAAKSMCKTYILGEDKRYKNRRKWIIGRVQ